MRTPLVAGNWKMNGTREANAALLAGVVGGADALAGVELAVCPPFVYLDQAGGALAGSPVRLGAQNVCDQDDGAYTGEVSARMLRDAGVHYVLVGHSERRALYGDDDARVAARFQRAQEQQLCPVLCVGETQQEREAGRTEAVIGRQIDAVLDAAGVAAFDRAVVAYEPVWAIGTGLSASPEQAGEVHAFIRQRIAARDATIAAGLRVLYGGSVKPANAAALFALEDIDGGLIGGASLNSDDFLAIAAAARRPD